MELTVEHTVGHSTTGGDGESILVMCKGHAVRAGALNRKQRSWTHSGRLFHIITFNVIYFTFYGSCTLLVTLQIQVLHANCD